MKTRASLGIFWTFEEMDNNGDLNSYQDEVDGIVFFGHWPTKLSLALNLNLSSFSDRWLGSKTQVKGTTWDSSNYNCYSVEVYVQKWPNQASWMRIVESSLSWFCEQGALLSWCGGETCSPALEVFDADSSAGEVYAAYAPSVGFVCNSDLFDDYAELSKNQLEQFKTILE